MQRAEAREIKYLYAELSKAYGVPWGGRDSSKNSDPVNAAITLGHSCLYSLCHSIIHALNLSPGLGVVHHGNYRSFTLDIADIYKNITTIPAAFDIIRNSKGSRVAPDVVRKRSREDMFNIGFMKRVVGDILIVLGLPRDSRIVSFVDSNQWWS
jgi:CRISPR-associated protein Cas1